MTSDVLNTESEASPHQIIGSWLAAYANGQAKDQNAAYLDRVIRTRVEEFRAKQKSGNGSPQAAIDRFITDYVRGEAAATVASSILDMHIQGRIAAATEGVDGTDGGNVEPSAIVDELSSTVQEQEERITRLEGELARAHDWRFHLELHAREARAALLRAANGDRDLQSIASTLQAAIGWAP